MGHRPSAPAVTPDLFRGPEPPVRASDRLPWTPEQVRGDIGGQCKAEATNDERCGRGRRRFSLDPLCRRARTCSGHPRVAARRHKLGGRAGGGTWIPGTSPLLSGLEFRHGFRAHGRAHLRAPCCHPGLVPGSRTPRKPAHSSRICVYGGAGPRNKSGVTIGTGAPCAGVPQCVSRVERSAGNPLVPRPHSQPMKVKPDTSGTSPGM